MNATVKAIAPEPTSLIKAQRCWNEAAPDWIVALAIECDRTSQRRAARRLGISESTINRALSNSYGASLASIEEKVRGSLMGKEVTCPVLGLIGADRCQREQRMPKTFSSPIRVRLHKACRSGCQHSHLGDGK